MGERVIEVEERLARFKKKIIKRNVRKYLLERDVPYNTPEFSSV